MTVVSFTIISNMFTRYYIYYEVETLHGKLHQRQGFISLYGACD